MKALLAIISCQLVFLHSKIYNRCDLAYELIHSHGFAQGSISEWICLIANESGYNTAWKKGPNKYDGSYDWGIFAVNDYYWCSGSGQAAKYNDCHISCNNLINNDISDDCDCAKTIYKRHGFEAWHGWVDNCKGTDTSSYVNGCRLSK